MIGLLYEMFQPVNLVPSLLLLGILAYWLMAIIGAVGGELFDVDLDGADAPFGGFGVFKFFHVGDFPLMVVVSLFVVLFWATTIVSNHYYNPDSNGWVTAYFLFPNAIVSLLITKAILLPTILLFKQLTPEQSHDKSQYVGQLAQVQTSEITDDFGQIVIQHDGPPIVFNARCRGSRLVKGELVEIVEYQPDRDTFVVRLSKPKG